MEKSINIFEIIAVVFLSSLFSLGGGNGPIAVIQDQWVGPGILDPTLFAWVLAVSYLTPGPKVGFLSGIGYYIGGISGALAAIIGILIPTCLGAGAVTYSMKKIKPIITRLSLPAGFVIAGMIVAAAWSILQPMNLNLLEMAAVGAVAIGVGWKNLQPAIVILSSIGVGLIWWIFPYFTSLSDIL